MVTKWKITNGELWVRVDGRPWLRIFVYSMADRRCLSAVLRQRPGLDFQP